MNALRANMFAKAIRKLSCHTATLVVARWRYLTTDKHYADSGSGQVIMAPPTISYGLHGDPSSVLAVALLIELDHRLPSVLLRRMQ